MRDAAFGLIFAALLPAIFVSPCMGVLVWVWTALLSPNELLYGFMASIQLNRIVAIVTILVIFFSQEKKDPYLDPLLTLLILFTLGVAGSWATSIVSSDDGDNLFQKVLKEMALTAAITAVMTTRHRLHLLALAACAGFGMIGVKEGLIFLLTAGGHKVEGLQSVGDNNSLATALLMLTPFLYYLSRYSALRLVRIGLLTAMGLCLVTVVATYSRGGFVGLLVLGAFMVKNSRNRVSTLVLVALAGGLIWGLAPESWFTRLNSINEAGTDSSFLGRVNAWKVSTLIALDHPLLGGGPHAVQRFAVWFSYVPRISELDFIPTPPPDDYPRAAHSSYFEVLGDLGFTGLILFVGILGVAFWQCRSISRMTRHHPDLAWAGDLGRMMQISLVVYIVTTAALSMAYFEFFYVLLAMISRTRRTVQQAIAAEAAQKAGLTLRAPAAALRPRPAYAREATPG